MVMSALSTKADTGPHGIWAEDVLARGSLHAPELARAELKEVLTDDVHAPGFQRKRDRVWVRRAKGLLRKAEGH